MKSLMRSRAFVLGPILGGLYIVVLPLVAAAAVLWFLARQAGRALAAAGSRRGGRHGS